MFVNKNFVKFKTRCVNCGTYFIPIKGQTRKFCKKCLKIPLYDRDVKFTNLQYGLA